MVPSEALPGDVERGGARGRTCQNIEGNQKEMIRQTDDHIVSKPDTPTEQDLKKVPALADVRQDVRAAAARSVADLSRRRPPRRAELEKLGGALIDRLSLPKSYLGFAMVAMSNEFWREQFAAVPFKKRLLLLPHCLRDVDNCKGTYSSTGLLCAECGACRISEVKRKAETLGYRVITAEGTPEVLRMLLAGQADAILGVACLDSLEKAFGRVGELGIPNAAVPLLVDGCINTEVEFDQIDSWLTFKRTTGSATPVRTRSYVPLLRTARGLFEPGVLKALLSPEVTTQPSIDDPLTGTEAIAVNWLRAGGKRFRPFITLTAFATRTAGSAALSPGSDPGELFTEPVRRAAVAIEAFHKASLVHDDVEDDDHWRYGTSTLHERYGTAVAINVGDYLIGLGYQLLAGNVDELGAECTTDIINALTRAHLSLSRGQGAELLWRLKETDELKPLDALTGYALKTAPAFEAALFVGLRLAGPVEAQTAEAVRNYSRYLGVAYQVLNDLKDFSDDHQDKALIGNDLTSRRPTMLLAFACQACDRAGKRKLSELLRSKANERTKIEQLRQFYIECGVFDKARALVEKYRQRAHAVGAGVALPALGELMHFITEIVLK